MKKWRKHYELEKSIVEKIINRRKDLNITQLELSKLTGLKQPAIARIEKQVNSVTLTTLITIIDELDLKLELVPKR
ncbi:helix-turn-helix transcriptional regulator [Acholeplasma laidlawii]|nr:helix-turn-helix transcriptional regulator [Acholeplasma laidlawii]